MAADAVSSEAIVPPVEPSQALDAMNDGAADVPSAPAIDALDADLILHGLSVLTDLLNEASETLHQCLLTIEDKLQALPITQERWVPIHAAHVPAADAPASHGEQTVQERVFSGVAVTIIKLGSSANHDNAARRERRYELGYAAAGEAWALVTRLAGAAERQPLRDAPLDFRLKAIREIPALLKALDVRRPAASGEEAPGAAATAAPDATPAAA
jgi:hypothetical protein